MNFTKTLIAVAATVASVGAFAIPTATVGVSGSSFLTLTSNSPTNPPTIGNTGGAAYTANGTKVATITGGSVLSGDYSYSDMSAFGSPAGGTYLSVGPTSGSPSEVLAVTGGTKFVSFLWGSPDLYNLLTVYTNTDPLIGTSFTAAGLGLSTTGDQSTSAAKYVAFTTLGTERITRLEFASGANAFEAANFSITPVPEPETYALMLGGLGVLGFVARRRRAV